METRFARMYPSDFGTSPSNIVVRRPTIILTIAIKESIDLHAANETAEVDASLVQVTYHDTRMGVRYTNDARQTNEPLRRYQLQLHRADDVNALVELLVHRCTCVPAKISGSKTTLSPRSATGDSTLPEKARQGTSSLSSSSTIWTPTPRQSARCASRSPNKY